MSLLCCHIGQFQDGIHIPGIEEGIIIAFLDSRMVHTLDESRNVHALVESRNVYALEEFRNAFILVDSRMVFTLQESRRHSIRGLFCRVLLMTPQFLYSTCLPTITISQKKILLFFFIDLNQPCLMIIYYTI